jgi:hypothetical protein
MVKSRKWRSKSAAQVLGGCSRYRRLFPKVIVTQPPPIFRLLHPSPLHTDPPVPFAIEGTATVTRIVTVATCYVQEPDAYLGESEFIVSATTFQLPSACLV